MEILPQKEHIRKSNKRVRFTLPDDVDELPPSEPKRKKSPNSRKIKKFHTKKPINEIHFYTEKKKLQMETSPCTNNEGREPAKKKLHSLYSGDEPSTSELMPLSGEFSDGVMLDKNDNNCTSCTESCKFAKRNSLVKRKRSVMPRIDEKTKTDKPSSKVRKVISKKLHLKGKEITTHKSSTKRKITKSYESAVTRPKQRKVSDFKSRQRAKDHMKNKKYQKSKRSNSLSKCHITRLKHARSKRASSKCVTCQSKRSKVKVKKATLKVSKGTRKSDNKGLKPRLANRLKKSAKKKLSLKKSSVKKRKAGHKKISSKKRKENKLYKLVKKKPASKRKRKIKIIEIERELDVVEPLRVMLLKYRTFEGAYDNKYECCRKYCWDKWEEVYMDDILDDHE